MSNFLLFQPSGTAGGLDAQDFINNAFSDISLSADSNSGFSTTVLKNPLSQFFANDDAPKYEFKTLWIKDLVLLTDRSKWLNNKPTYQVVFNEQFPGISAYVCGNVRIRNVSQGYSVDLRSEGDFFGVTTVGRRVQFFLNNTAAASQTATVKVDGVANGTTISYGDSAQLSTGVNQWAAYVHAASQETRDIHDYQVVTATAQTLNVVGIGVYFENATTTVDFFPGSTYLNKTKFTTLANSGVSLPTLVNYNGAKVLAYKTTAGTYALSANERSAIISTALGASGFNTLTVATNQGASFPVGSGVGLRDNGGSFFLSNVTNVSTDTLTLGATLPQGISGSIFKAFNTGATVAISATLHSLMASVDLGSAFEIANVNSFENSQNTLYYNSPRNRYRVFGQSLQTYTIDGYRGVRPTVTNSFIQVDGNFQAAEMEFAALGGATAVIHATVSINGLPGVWSEQIGVTGMLRQTMFQDGMPGWNTFKFQVGGSFLNTVITKINLYELAPPMGITLGRLAQVDIYGSQINRSAVNATLMTVGTAQRIYADQFNVTGAWSFGVTAAAPGAVYAQGSSTNSTLNLQYYGKDFALIGSQSASLTITLDGSAIGATLNQLYSVSLLGFHTLSVVNRASLCILNAFDFVRPRGEIRNLQNLAAVPQLSTIPTIYSQSDTPQNPKNGDIWGADPKAGAVYVRMWNKWVSVQTSTITDDPNAGIGVVSHGGTGADFTTGNGNTDLYNSTSWMTGTTDTINGSESSGSDAAYVSQHLFVDYNNTSETIQLSSRAFNRASWSTFTNRGTAKTWSANTAFRAKSQFYANKGTTTGGSTAAASNAADAWNNASWASATAWGGNASNPGGAEINAILYTATGTNAAGSLTNDNETRTTTDTIGAATTTPATTRARATSNSVTGRSQFILWHSASGSASTTAYTWNGSSYSGAITSSSSESPTACSAMFNSAQGRSMCSGGSSTNFVDSYNGTAFMSLSSMVNNHILGSNSFL
jgi:hypothetical protein